MGLRAHAPTNGIKLAILFAADTSSGAASVPDSDRQREDAGLFQANWAAGTYRPESGNASSQEAERQLQESAMADGILRTAQQNAASTISSLLQGLGFEKIDFG